VQTAKYKITKNEVKKVHGTEYTVHSTNKYSIKINLVLYGCSDFSNILHLLTINYDQSTKLQSTEIHIKDTSSIEIRLRHVSRSKLWSLPNSKYNIKTIISSQHYTSKHQLSISFFLTGQITHTHFIFLYIQNISSTKMHPRTWVHHHY